MLSMVSSNAMGFTNTGIAAAAKIAPKAAPQMQMRGRGGGRTVAELAQIANEQDGIVVSTRPGRANQRQQYGRGTTDSYGAYDQRETRRGGGYSSSGEFSATHYTYFPVYDASPYMFAYGLPGNILGDFDPFGFSYRADQDTVYKYREAELVHGRVAMLAVAGFLVQEEWHPLFAGVNNVAIDQIPALPYWVWGIMLAGIGYCEQVRIARGWEKLSQDSMTADRTLRFGYYPGDLDFDPLNLAPQDPAEFRLMQEKELAHSRLAMVAAVGFLVQESYTGTTWSSYSSFFGYP